MSAAGSDAHRNGRHRPKNRKALIARASADAFGAQGYHAVSMEEIAARVGISPAALYRHSQGKYDLFRDSVLGLGQLLVDATDFGDDVDPAEDPHGLLAALVDALINVTIANRTAGGLYRWEGRYLREPDRDILERQIQLVNRRLQRPLRVMRPELGSRQRWTLTASALSAIGSIADHSAPLSVPGIRSFLASVVEDLLAADLPTPRRRRAPDPPPPRVTLAAGIYECVLHESIQMFHERGFRDTGMDDIAAAVGVPTTGIYRYFPGKADILAASLRRAVDRTSQDLARITAATADPHTALTQLVRAYLDQFRERPALAYVQHTERRNLPESEARVVERIEQSLVDSWARLVTEQRPELTVATARYAVYCAFALVTDLGRLTDSHASPSAQAAVQHLMEVVLLGG
ncbi:TetR/AcrR family transcriptional regulator [Mycolicibacterium thermoresistibile]|uniref:TetR family transcriptional regulator n=2 Tax=Mycolicibacterium thermoresistibile TaxID=1797 RepID=G7CDM8_MYCT3|nr:TetR/AcrR family transcriptional regulator [Mycolicibacterium thermoresistibile]EHI14052.1 TetR family transcriptional regulator [Mycolicibacterium thermoresistibile ATCC 19527]MCV7189434.1 TetR/AcrR family transcriptional regulator [Mycolicibacterium thermoresistibile]GAT15102.1 TetR family transcriptional regulator [Mycolicibacterium thermoresistibile]SNW16349.1 Transcriptional regulator, TetR family [Mycolicibacterium thermoresistibile]